MVETNYNEISVTRIEFFKLLATHTRLLAAAAILIP